MIFSEASMATTLDPKQIVSYEELLMSIVSENPVSRRTYTLTPEVIQSTRLIRWDYSEEGLEFGRGLVETWVESFYRVEYIQEFTE
jgi:hypothetical protein